MSISSSPTSLLDDPKVVEEYLSLCSARSSNDPTILDRYLHDKLISSAGVVARENNNALHNCMFFRKNRQLMYLLTCVPPPNVNLREDRDGYTPMLYGLINSINGANSEGVKMLIDFGADVTVENEIGETPEQVLLTKIQEAERRHDEFSDQLYSTYMSLFNKNVGYISYAKEELKLSFQLESKLQIDSIFKNQGGRFNQAKIDEKFDSIWERLYPGLRRAVQVGNLAVVNAELQDKEIIFLEDANDLASDRHSFPAVLLQKSKHDNEKDGGEGEEGSTIRFMSLPLLLHITIEAIENDQLHLLDCLIDKICRFISRGGVTEPLPADNTNSGVCSLNYLTASGYSIYDILLDLNFPFATDLVEKLLMVGLDAVRTRPKVTYVKTQWMPVERGYINFCPMPDTLEPPKLPAVPLSVVETVNLSRVLLIFNILLNNKSVYLDEDITYIVAQMLMFDETLFEKDLSYRFGNDEIVINDYKGWAKEKALKSSIDSTGGFSGIGSSSSGGGNYNGYSASYLP